MAFRSMQFVPLGIGLLLIGACALQRAQEASKAQATLLGMSKEQVLTCMGSPRNSAAVGSTEVWSYFSGDGRTDTFGVVNTWGSQGWLSGFGSATTASRYCKVDVVMVDGRVTHLNYSGPTGGLLSKGEQCAYAVENCRH
jgi:hypothetical protein